MGETKVGRGDRYLRGEVLGRNLTPSEIKVLNLVAKGYSNYYIGEKLELSTQTVKNHVHHILRKLGVADRTSAVLVALEKGYDIYSLGSSSDLGKSVLNTKLGNIESRLNSIGEDLKSIKISLNGSL